MTRGKANISLKNIRQSPHGPANFGTLFLKATPVPKDTPTLNICRKTLSENNLRYNRQHESCPCQDSNNVSFAYTELRNTIVLIQKGITQSKSGITTAERISPLSLLLDHVSLKTRIWPYPQANPFLNIARSLESAIYSRHRLTKPTEPVDLHFADSAWTQASRFWKKSKIGWASK